MTTHPLINRVVGHHSGGAHKPNKTDLLHYHRVVDAEGMIHMGKFDFADNTGKLREGRYAAHTRNLNSNTGGVAMACMGKSEWSKPYDSPFFPKPEQVDRFILLMADVCNMFRIPIEREYCLTHAEVERTLGVKQRNKWDFDYSIFGSRAAVRDPIRLGDELRQAITLVAKESPVPASVPTFSLNVGEDFVGLRRGDKGDLVKRVQKALSVEPDGHFGPATEQAVKAYQKKLELRPDGVVGPYTLRKLLGS